MAAVAAVSSLEAMLGRKRLSGDPSLILIHGPYAADCMWLLRYMCIKAGNDPDSAVIVSDRIPGDMLDSPGVGLMRLTGMPVIETCTSEAAAGAATALQCVATGITDCLHRRGTAHVHGHDAATLPDMNVGVCFESLTTLLLGHTYNEVARFLLELSRKTENKARALPLIVCVDAGVIGVATVMALEAQASIVVRVDQAPAPQAGESGYLGGEMTVTERLKSGKERSIIQTYSVHPNGSVIIGAAKPAPASAALMPVPVVPPKEVKVAPPAPATTSGGIRSVPATTTPAATGADTKPAETSATVTIHKAPGVSLPDPKNLYDDDGQPLIFFEAGDPEHELDLSDEEDDVDDDLDI